MPKAVIADLHGDTQGLHGILRQIGAVDDSLQKLPDWHLIQLGDFVHCGGDAKDLRCAEEVLRLFDEILLGNHEAAVFNIGPKFAGYREDYILGHQLRLAWKEGRFKAATTVGKWLISHAGVHPIYWGWPVANHNPQSIAKDLNTYLAEAIDEKIGTQVIATVGEDRSLNPNAIGAVGGVLWCGFEELKAGYAAFYAPENVGAELSHEPLSQIVGHTPQRIKATDEFYPQKAEKWPLVCTDVGAALSGYTSAVVTHDDGETWETFVFDSVVDRYNMLQYRPVWHP